jgi:hypothetical protein
MKTDRVLSRPAEQRVAIGNAYPGVIAGSARVAAIDGSRGARELLLNGDLATL